MSLKVLCVVDKAGTALDRLAQGVARYHDNLDYVVCDFHPKRPDQEQIKRFEEESIDADIIDFQYFRSAKKILELYPWLQTKKLILTHNNPYSIYEDEWAEFDMLVANNKSIQAELKRHTAREVEHVPITTDAFFWEYKRDWKPGRRVIMVANRIESKKGILPVAIACGDAGMRLTLVGAVSDRQYLHDILQTQVVDFHEQVSDEELEKLYHDATIHVCNSVDGFESGTMPILEAMQCGIPVMTRRIGHVPDLFNGDNLHIYDGDPEDTIAIRQELERMINGIANGSDGRKARTSHPNGLETQRQSAWNTSKNFNFERRAYEYQKLYRKVMSDAEPVSVIVPIYGKPEVIRACLNAVASQDYPNIELVVVDDDNGFVNELLVEEFAKTVSFPVRYINSTLTQSLDDKDYGLARARNLGVIESTGSVVVFCDQRQIMEPNAVSELVSNLVPRTWVYGDKGGKKDFVENFSAVFRQEVIVAGMFCERMDGYGGLSQETRSRTRMQGFKHVFVESAKAKPMGASKRKHTEKPDIIRIKNRLYKMGL